MNLKQEGARPSFFKVISIEDQSTGKKFYKLVYQYYFLEDLDGNRRYHPLSIVETEYAGGRWGLSIRLDIPLWAGNELQKWLKTQTTEDPVEYNYEVGFKLPLTVEIAKIAAAESLEDWLEEGKFSELWNNPDRPQWHSMKYDQMVPLGYLFKSPMWQIDKNLRKLPTTRAIERLAGEPVGEDDEKLIDVRIVIGHFLSDLIYGGLWYLYRDRQKGFTVDIADLNGSVVAGTYLRYIEFSIMKEGLEKLLESHHKDNINIVELARNLGDVEVILYWIKKFASPASQYLYSTPSSPFRNYLISGHLTQDLTDTVKLLEQYLKLLIEEWEAERRVIKKGIYRDQVLVSTARQMQQVFHNTLYTIEQVLEWLKIRNELDIRKKIFSSFVEIANINLNLQLLDKEHEDLTSRVLRFIMSLTYNTLKSPGIFKLSIFMFIGPIIMGLVLDHIHIFTTPRITDATPILQIYPFIIKAYLLFAGTLLGIGGLIFVLLLLIAHKIQDQWFSRTLGSFIRYKVLLVSFGVGFITAVTADPIIGLKLLQCDTKKCGKLNSIQHIWNIMLSSNWATVYFLVLSFALFLLILLYRKNALGLSLSNIKKYLYFFWAIIEEFLVGTFLLLLFLFMPFILVKDYSDLIKELHPDTHSASFQNKDIAHKSISKLILTSCFPREAQGREDHRQLFNSNKSDSNKQSLQSLDKCYPNPLYSAIVKGLLLIPFSLILGMFLGNFIIERDIP